MYFEKGLYSQDNRETSAGGGLEMKGKGVWTQHLSKMYNVFRL